MGGGVSLVLTTLLLIVLCCSTFVVPTTAAAWNPNPVANPKAVVVSGKVWQSGDGESRLSLLVFMLLELLYWYWLVGLVQVVDDRLYLLQYIGTIYCSDTRACTFRI